jgi:hypothetical protein
MSPTLKTVASSLLGFGAVLTLVLVAGDLFVRRSQRA